MKIDVIVIIIVQDTLVLGMGVQVIQLGIYKKCIVAHNKDDNTDLKQSKLYLGSSGLVNQKYNAEEAKESLTKFTVQDEQPFSFSEKKKFESCV